MASVDEADGMVDSTGRRRLSWPSLPPANAGKDERFHRTLQAEVISRSRDDSFSGCQIAFDDWRAVYNLRRPHEALDLNTPVTRYSVSPRAFPEVLPTMMYSPRDEVRKVQSQGEVHFRGKIYVVSHAFRGHQVALRPSEVDGVWDVFYHHQWIACVDERTGACSCRREERVEAGAPGSQASVRSAHSGPAAGGVLRNAGRP